MTVKDFLDTNDFTKDQLLDMIELARVHQALRSRRPAATRSS